MFKAVNNNSAILATAAEKQLRAQWDPTSDTQDEANRKRMDVKKVYSVLPADRRGFEEILYVDNNETPWTAVVTGKAREIVSVEAGW
jgi:hypothetical protein